MCSKYCISNYEPILFESRQEFLAVYQDALLNLIGKTIDSYFLLCDERDHEWNKDAPTILQIDGRHYEFTAFQIDYFDMTIDEVDFRAKIDWYAEEDREYFSWKQNYLSWVNKVIGRRILGINLLDSHYSRISIADEFPNQRDRDFENHWLCGIEFMVDKTSTDGPYSFLQIYNDTDEIGIEVINYPDFR